MQKKSEPVNADFWGKDRVYVRPKRKEIFKGEIRVIGLKLRRFRQKIGLNSSIKYSVLALTGFVFVIWLS
ncbi:hypothetical protein STA3757_49730 (plasmid) [Stanieria sp. NIES-3757]|nr:hypothetical protein STA3757_49730 [Stanieria sp. NIES-3757]